MNWICKYLGHNYQARFDSELPVEVFNRIQSVDGAEGTKQLQTMRRSTYVHDVCTRCGQVVERAHTPDGKEIPR